jgi:hypothetical protein
MGCLLSDLVDATGEEGKFVLLKDWQIVRKEIHGKNAYTGALVSGIKVKSCTMGEKVEGRLFGLFTSVGGNRDHGVVVQVFEFKGENDTLYVAPVRDAFGGSISKFF